MKSRAKRVKPSRWTAEALEPRMLLAAQLFISTPTGTADSKPSGFTALNGLVLFSATGPLGNELYRTDGTPEGTGLVADIFPGIQSSNPTGLTAYDNAVYFSASSDNTQDTALYKTDGTAAGTAPVNSQQQTVFLNPGNFTVVDTKLYFTAAIPFSGTKLWFVNGPNSVPIAVAGVPSQITGPLVQAGPYVYFVGQDQLHGTQLWRTDASGTVATLVDVLSGSNILGPQIQNLAPCGNRLVFTAVDSSGDRQVYSTDGTAAGTQQVSTYPFYSTPGNVIASGPYVYFTASGGPTYDLYRTDGTPAGTQLLSHLIPDLSSVTPSNFTACNNLLFFRLYTAASGYELWESNGTTAGTQMVKDVNPGSGSSVPDNLTAVGNTLYFTASDGAWQDGLWQTDGTAAGTFFVGPVPRYPLNAPRAGNGDFIYSDRDPFAGVEPFASDGSAGGSILLSDINTTVQSNYLWGFINAVHVGNYVYFDAQSPPVTPYQSQALWRTDGTVAGTSCLSNPAPTFAPAMRSANQAVEGPDGSLYYIDTSGYLWVTDGTVAGTRELKQVAQGNSLGSLFQMVRVGNLVYFAGSGPTPTTTTALWRTDGTVAGTYALPASGAIGTDPNSGAALEGYFYFNAPDPAVSPTLQALWRTDGTLAGTSVFLEPASLGNTSSLQVLGASNTALFFTPGAPGTPVWATDGIATTPVQLPAGKPGMAHAILNGVFYFFDNGFYRSDGTAPGTIQLANVNSTSALVAGNTLYFSAANPNDPSSNTLWKSDGSAGGTAPLMAAGSSADPLNPGSFIAAGNLLYYETSQQVTTGGTSSTQDDLWHTDGTPGGTVLDLSNVQAPNHATQPVIGMNNPYGPALMALDFSGHPERISPAVPSGSISGHVFDDVNNDGVFEPDDSPLPLRQVYLDLNNNGQFDGQDISAYTDNSGAFDFARIEPGTYIVRQIPVNGRVQTSNSGQGYAVTVGNQPVTGIDFGSVDMLPRAVPMGPAAVFVGGQISIDGTASFSQSGPITKYEWAFDYDPSQPFEASATGPQASFPAGATPGGHRVGLRVTDSTGQVSPVASLFITVAFPATISGSVYNDANNNAALDAGESGISGVTVYIDANDNGKLDSGEASALTDPSGNYTLSHLLPGAAIVREVPPAGYAQTAPAEYAARLDLSSGQSAVAPAFGNVLLSSVTLNLSYFSLLTRNFGQPGTFASGDLNGDGTVNLADLLLLTRNFGHVLSTGSGAATPAARATRSVLRSAVRRR